MDIMQTMVIIVAIVLVGKMKKIIKISLIIIIIIFLGTILKYKLVTPEDIDNESFDQNLLKLYNSYVSDEILNLSSVKLNFLHGLESEEMAYIAISELNESICEHLNERKDDCKNDYYMGEAIKTNIKNSCLRITNNVWNITCQNIFESNSCSKLVNIEEQKICTVFKKYNSKTTKFNSCEDMSNEINNSQFSVNTCKLYKQALKN